MHSERIRKVFSNNESLCLTAVKIISVILPVAGITAVCLATPLIDELRAAIKASQFLHILSFVGLAIISLNAIFYAWLTWAALRYRPIPGAANAELPRVTVVVPAFNEGKMVLETLCSLANGDYPPEKLQLIAVDDGSQDDTWHWILEAERLLPGRITALRQLRNSGKRRALYEGFRRATGDILVTVDSDSIVNPDTLRNLVSPFIQDEDCGAVAGNVRVLNKERRIIPKMLDVSFVFSFEFVRSAHSYRKTVLCTPGALAAYRKDLVQNVLEEWLEQKFLGREANIGEDRALTNLILKQGKSVLFQNNAVVFTSVPTHYRNLCKMFIRWGRSNVRENLKMQSYVFKRFRSHHRTTARYLIIMQQLWSLPTPLMFTFMIWMLLTFPLQTVMFSFAGVAMWSTLPALVYARRYSRSDAFWAYAYGLFFAFCLSWITPFSLLTMHRSGWLTRTLDKKATIHPLQLDNRIAGAAAAHTDRALHIGNMN